YVDDLPVSNADVGTTIAEIMGLQPKPHGKLIGRVMTEAMPKGNTPKVVSDTIKSDASANGLRTMLVFQRVGSQRYFDAAGFPGRTVGLPAEGGNKKTAVEKPRRCSEGSMLARELHSDIEHEGNLGQRQRGDANQRRHHRHQPAVGAVLAAHLACDPFQDLGVDALGV